MMHSMRKMGKISFLIAVLLLPSLCLAESSGDLLNSICSELLENRSANIKYLQTLLSEDINESKLVTEIIQSSKEIENDLNYFTLIFAAFNSMETQRDKMRIEKILIFIKETIVEKITHEKEFINRRIPLSKNEETKDIAKRLLKNLSELEMALNKTKITEEGNVKHIKGD